MRVQQVAIGRGTAHPEAAWLWLTFLSHQSPVGQGLPARRTVTAVINYWDTLDEPIRVAVQASVERGVTFTPNNPAQTALDTAVANIVTGRETVETALQMAQETAVAQAESQSDQPEESLSVTGPPETADEKTTIVFMAPDAPFDFMSPYPGLVEAFAEEQPNINVELRALVRADANQTFAEMVADVDCFADSTIVVQTNPDLIIPIDPLFDNDPALSPDDFYAVSIFSG